MTAQILDGKALAATIKAELRERVAALAERGITPGLGTILVGDDPGSRSYVRGKHRDCAEVGIASIQVELPASASAAELEAVKAENDHTARECAKLPGRAFGFASVNPLRDYAPGEIERCLSLPGIAGVKLHFDNSRVSLRDEQHAKAVRAVLLVAAKRNAPALVHMDNRQPEFGAEDARAFLDQVLAELPPMEVYIAHLGTGGGYDESTRAVLGVFEKALPGLKHKVFLDVSGIALPAAFRGIEPLTLEQGKELAATMRRMGLGRFVFGTDFSVTDSATYRSSLRAALP